MALEIKLAIRNKRPRQILWSALMFSAAGVDKLFTSYPWFI